MIKDTMRYQVRLDWQKLRLRQGGLMRGSHKGEATWKEKRRVL
ncbi:unnamed protein product [Brassica rapa subsp. narinosa]